MLLKSIYLKNILSYATGMERLELGPLNVLIGPNASGKSNLIEAISVLAAAPRDLQAPIQEGGGILEWLWKGGEQTPIASLEATFSLPRQDEIDLRYHLEFKATNGPLPRLELVDETIESALPTEGTDKAFVYYAYQRGQPVLNYIDLDTQQRKNRKLRSEDVKSDKSILLRSRDAEVYPELSYLASQLESIRFYREGHFGRYTSLRVAQKPDLPNVFLAEEAWNLALVINRLQTHHPDTMARLLSLLQDFYEPVKDIIISIENGYVQIYLQETGLRRPVPAIRLSDGMLRYLCLLVILCHPSPPPLICLEEPELGMHPDSLVTIARLITECVEEQRTQLIVTTHSDILIDALTDMPEAVVVCDKREAQGTQLKRLKPKELAVWLEDSSLGQLWTQGEIGGNRW
jgi:predicted ATPase